MNIYNSLTGKKEEFTPVQDGVVNIYTCGVTVYDQCHIGHARSLYIFEVMRKYLEYSGYKVNFVRNITDIDDKIINRSNELNIGWEDLVAKYIESYKEDLNALGVRFGILDKDGEEPRATKSIPEIIEYIAVLIEKGYAYESAGNVYFDVRKFPGYGRLSGQDIENMQKGIKQDMETGKRDLLDFALWKRSKEKEPSWPSPWGKGRPGWHIECSVMSQKFLNTSTLDIHAGGRDLIFPHHENEIAQAEAYTGKAFARYWVHHGLLTINGCKMSKSLGNFISIKDALKSYDVDSLKILFLQAHYSSPVDFSEKKINEANAALRRFRIFFDRADNTGIASKKDVIADSFRDGIGRLKKEFIEVMDDDFNTPQALAKLFEILAIANVEFLQNNANIKYACRVLEELSGVLGINLKPRRQPDSELELYIRDRINERNIARANKDFETADIIRDQLQAKGIMIEDTKEGTIWRKL
jgi:cysteinyl-tRNA synthetase